MTNPLIAIGKFIIESFISIWPYLLITIPIAVAVNLSGASKYIKRAFEAKPIVAIFLATAVGAFSPFCSCGVIPVIASLLIGGVPLAPVMAFWIASPSMDPEIFFLSVATLGWPLALWRLGATFFLSIGAGFVTHLFITQGWLGTDWLRENYSTESQSIGKWATRAWEGAKAQFQIWADKVRPVQLQPESCCVAATNVAFVSMGSIGVETIPDISPATSSSCASGACSAKPPTFRQRLVTETWSATKMVVKFMALAFFLEALIILYVPETFITNLLGHNNPWAIPVAALLGVPVYTSNLAALPLIGGLLTQGMNPAAALAFLIAGPMTTLPAMAAVWGLVKPRVFTLYVLTALVGAVLMGYVYVLVN